MTATTSVTVTARVIDEVSSNALATVTQATGDPSFWHSIISFITHLL